MGSTIVFFLCVHSRLLCMCVYIRDLFFSEFIFYHFLQKKKFQAPPSKKMKLDHHPIAAVPAACKLAEHMDREFKFSAVELVTEG